MRRIVSLLLCFCLLVPLPVQAKGYRVGMPYQARLEGLMKDSPRRDYVRMMLDYYLRNDTMVQMALEREGSAVFFFEGCSDHMEHPDLSDLSYYRVSAVCVVVRRNELGEPYIAYFNDDCSTLPDRPLDLTAWHFDEVGDVGPATICDGTYEVYSVRHGGSYEALHIRTDYSDGKIPAVYMTPDGFVNARATEINIHTRTGNHVLKNQMWSAGCILVGDGNRDTFTELMACTYYANYNTFALDQYVGSVTINRRMLRDVMYDLYENRDAVDRLLTATTRLEPETYLASCGQLETFSEPLELCVRGTAMLMTLPCSNSTDARSVAVEEVRRGQVLNAIGSYCNSEGRLWYQIPVEGELRYLFGGYAEEVSWQNWITRTLYH